MRTLARVGGHRDVSNVAIPKTDKGFSALHYVRDVDIHASAGAHTLVTTLDDFESAVVDGRDFFPRFAVAPAVNVESPP